MKMKQSYSSAIFLIRVLLRLLSSAVYESPTNVDINFSLNSKNHSYFLISCSDKERQTLKDLYQLNQGRLLWFSTEHLVTIINQLLELFSNAPIQGLNIADYTSQNLTALWQKIKKNNPDFHEFATFDITLP